MTKRIAVWKMLLPVTIFAACGGGPELDTRTFQLQSMPVDEALMIIEPYVYGDRPNAPGTANAMRGLLTVRETPDNLEKIARVLSEYDVPRRSVQLHIQLIAANGEGTADSAIAEVEAELRQLLRFDGYQLVAQGVLTALEGSGVSQTIFDQREPSTSTYFASFHVQAFVGDIAQSADSAVVTLQEIQLRSNDLTLFGASVALGVGHTIVLGTMQLPGNEALILTMRAELVE